MKIVHKKKIEKKKKKKETAFSIVAEKIGGSCPVPRRLIVGVTVWVCMVGNYERLRLKLIVQQVWQKEGKIISYFELWK